MSAVLGIDPGAGGAVAVYWPDLDDLLVWDMPVHRIRTGKSVRSQVDPVGLARLVRSVRSDVDLAVVEEVGSRPNQGVASGFSFGRHFGHAEMVVAAHAIPLELVKPHVWKRALRVKADKDHARRRASDLLPAHADYWARAKDHDRAEAALLAYFGQTFLRSSVLG